MSPSLFKNDAPPGSVPGQGVPSPAADERGDRSRRKERSSNGVISVFGPGLTVEGQVHSNGDVQIEGRVHGDLIVEGQVSVATSGSVEGDIAGDRVVVAGKVNGTIRASEGARLVDGAMVKADITSPRLQLEEGATLDGRVQMSSGSKKTEARPSEKGQPAKGPQGATSPDSARTSDKAEGSDPQQAERKQGAA